MSTADAWLAAAEPTLLQAGYQPVAPPPNAPPGTRMYRRSDFKLRWMNKAQTFVVVTPGPSATGDDVRSFAALALAWAQQVKGGLPAGLGAGVVAIGVLLTDHATPDAHTVAAQRPTKDFGAFRMPILVDLATGTTTTFTGRMVYGVAFRSWIRKQQRLIAGIRPGTTTPR